MVNAHLLYRRSLKVTRLMLGRGYDGSKRIARALTRDIRTTYHGLSLRRVHNNVRRIRKSDVLLVTCLRNEMIRMPFFLDYYRGLGVDHFLIVDNGSTDGFLDYARKWDDCSVWHTRASYRRAAFGMQWCNYLLRRFGVNHLCVTVDPDEFLVYPFMETRSLHDLGQFLKDDRRECAHALMIDAYGDRPVAETTYRSGDVPFAVCPFFDRDGYTQRPGNLRSTFVQGGPRMRIYFCENPELSPALNKVPLVWWKRNFNYHSSMHDLEPRRLNLAHARAEFRSIAACSTLSICQP